jgi:hypothetical protein
VHTRHVPLAPDVDLAGWPPRRRASWRRTSPTWSMRRPWRRPSTRSFRGLVASPAPGTLHAPRRWPVGLGSAAEPVQDRTPLRGWPVSPGVCRFAAIGTAFRCDRPLRSRRGRCRSGTLAWACARTGPRRDHRTGPLGRQPHPCPSAAGDPWAAEYCLMHGGCPLDGRRAVISDAVRGSRVRAGTGSPRAALPRTAAAVPMPRSARPCRAGCSGSAGDRPARSSCAELRTARRGRR